MLEQTKVTIPWWLTIILVLETLPMFLGPVVALMVPGFMGGPEAESINQAAFIYTNRNVAVGLALLIAWVLRNGPMLFVLIFIRLITDLGDLPTVLYYNLVTSAPRTIAIFVCLYYIPAIFALRYLWQQMTRSDGETQSNSGDNNV
ncbi:MAG: hypothetical protein AAFQ66_03525 [Pseudomonadota bacterium]